MSSLISNSDIIASSYKNNSLPLEGESDDKLVLYTKDDQGSHFIKILDFDGERDVVCSLQLSAANCPAYPSIAGDYKYSIAFFNDLNGTTERFFVIIGFGKLEGLSKIWYFVFDLHDSEYRYLNCGEFDEILEEDGVDAQYFRNLTVAPKGESGICRLSSDTTR